MSDSNQEELEDHMIDIGNKNLQAKYNRSIKIKVPLNNEEKDKWKTSKKAYAECVQKHLLNQQKAFAIIIGQCTQRLQDKMHDNDKWNSVNKNQKPLELYALIKRVVMKQTGDEYPPCNVVDNLLSVLLMKQQQNMSNAQWYEQFCARVDVAKLVGFQFNSFKCLWDYCIQKKDWGEYFGRASNDLIQIKEQLFA
jgi:hypothetical protein